MTIVASYNDILVLEIVAAPNVAVVAGRVFRYDPSTGDDSVFFAHNSDKLHVRKDDSRLIVTGWKNSAGDDSATLITGTEGDSVYRSDGKTIGFMTLAQRIAESGKEKSWR